MELIIMELNNKYSKHKPRADFTVTLSAWAFLLKNAAPVISKGVLNKSLNGCRLTQVNMKKSY